MLEGFEQYEGREQSWVKHYVLRKYLERFGPIIGFGRPSITYVDGFSGPWKIQSDKMEDTSFSIALTELRKARETHAQRGKNVRLRCVFLEEDQARFSQLSDFASQVTDAEVLPLNSSFEQAIPDVIGFLDRDRDTFPFVFIDPTGWTGFSMQTIAPLLKRRPCEVLINFMLDFIRRFIENDFSRESFSKLFGSDDFDAGLKDLQGLKRDDAIADRYCRSLRDVCGFDFVQRAIVLHPDQDKTHFLLIYGTRNIRGVEVFKDAEERAMRAQDQSRARVEERRKSMGGQKSLFPSDIEDTPESRHNIELRQHYGDKAKKAVVTLLNSERRVAYDKLWLAALAFQMVREKDLREWLKEWRDNGELAWHGLAPTGRVLKRGKVHFVTLTGGELQSPL